MDEETLESVLEQVLHSKMAFRRIDLHNGGETLLHPNFRRMMELLGRARSRTEGFPYTTLLTNATVLDEAKSKAILDTGAIDVIRFSVDGGTRDEFERIRKGAD